MIIAPCASIYRDDFTDERDLFTAQQPRMLDEHDAGMDLSRTGELDEVVDIRGREHAIFLVGTLEDVVIGCSENPAVPNVACVDAIGG